GRDGGWKAPRPSSGSAPSSPAATSTPTGTTTSAANTSVSTTPNTAKPTFSQRNQLTSKEPHPLEYARVERHAVSLEWTFPDGGKLDFLSAGRQNRDYSAAVCSLDWDNFYDRLGGGRFFRAMRDDMKQRYDYVLIDSRTGLSDVADICTI